MLVLRRQTVTVARVAELACSGFRGIPALTNKVEYNPGRHLSSAHAFRLDVHTMHTYICIQKIDKQTNK